MEETNIHQDGAITDMVKLHRVRETLNDLLNIQINGQNQKKMVANTINILKVEMSKESPDAWSVLKSIRTG